MIRLKDLLLEATEAVMDLQMAQHMAARLAKELDAPYVQAQVSTLGGAHRPSVMLKVSLDPKEVWVNSIYHNSRYSQWHIGWDGTIDQFTAHLSKNFRKARFKTVDDVINKLNAYIKQVD